MKPGVRIPSSAPAAGCRTQVAHLTQWGVFFCACAEAGIYFVNVSQKQKSPRASGGSFAFDRCARGKTPSTGGETAAEKKKREERRRDRRNAGENSITFKSLRTRQRQAAAPKPHTSLCGVCFLLRLHRKRASFLSTLPSGRLPHPSRTPHPVGYVFFCTCTEAGVFLRALPLRRGLEPIRALDFFEAGARAERVFLRRKPHRSGFGGNSHSGLSFLFCLFARVYGGGAFGRRKPSGQSPLSRPIPPAVGGFFGPCRTVFKGPGQAQRLGPFLGAARPTVAPENGLAPPCAGRRRFAFWQGVCYNDGNLLAGPAAPAPVCRGRRGAGPPHSNTALF